MRYLRGLFIAVVLLCVACNPREPEPATDILAAVTDTLRPKRPPIRLVIPQPIVYVDEQHLSLTPHYVADFPEDVWLSVGNCLVKRGLHLDMEWVRAKVLRPRLIIVQRAAGIVVHDLTADSLFNRRTLSEIAIGYSLVGAHAIVIIESRAREETLLRHEAIHFYLWGTIRIADHPPHFFVCEEPEPMR